MSEPSDYLITHRAPASVLQGALDAIDAPRPRGPRRVAGAVLAFLLGVGLTGSLALLGQHEPTPEPVAVRLALHAPDAASVAVAGSWNAWSPTPMFVTERGHFTVSLRLAPGQYEYQFVVDGERWVVDPSAPVRRDDGFGSQNAVLEI